jgi:hypothetical protein
MMSISWSLARLHSSLCRIVDFIVRELKVASRKGKGYFFFFFSLTGLSGLSWGH